MPKCDLKVTASMIIPLTLRIKLAAIDIGVQLEPCRGGDRGRGAFTCEQDLSLAATALQHSEHHFLHTRQLLPFIEMPPVPRLLWPLH